MTFGGGEVAGAKIASQFAMLHSQLRCSNLFNFITSQHRGMFQFVLIILLEYMSDEEDQQDAAVPTAACSKRHGSERALIALRPWS